MSNEFRSILNKRKVVNVYRHFSNMVIDSAGYVLSNSDTRINGVSIFIRNTQTNDWGTNLICTANCNDPEALALHVNEFCQAACGAIADQENIIVGSSEDIGKKIDKEIPWMNSWNMAIAPGCKKDPICMIMAFISQDRSISKQTENLINLVAKELDNSIKHWRNIVVERNKTNKDGFGDFEQHVEI